VSRDFRPRKGHLLRADWPADQPIPDGWTRVDGWPLIERIGTGEPADTAVDVSSYVETVDCGVSSVKRMKQSA
jgi:hypothetical protein